LVAGTAASYFVGPNAMGGFMIRFHPFSKHKGLPGEARQRVGRGFGARDTLAVSAVVLAATTVGMSAAMAQTKAPPYAGKQIRMVIASGAGGGYDIYARILSTHLADHIPGHPTIINENMPGGGGMVGLNWAYNVAPKDGSVILSSFNVTLMTALFHDKQARFDPRKMASIGSIGKQQNICATWYTSPIKTLDQAKQQEVTVSAEGANSNSATLPLILNTMLGTKFKVITGYSTDGMRLAAQNGEVQGICGLSWSTLKASNPDWVSNHRLNVLAQTGRKAQADLPDVPVLRNLVSNPDDKEILNLLEFPGELGRPFLMPPGSPPELVDTIRKAFDETVKDPAFLADAQKASMEVDPVSADAMQKVINDAYATPEALVKKAAPFSGIPGAT
jgi:tripartite-type tricarboxylate transporter receptor subunit TctC